MASITDPCLALRLNKEYSYTCTPFLCVSGRLQVDIYLLPSCVPQNYGTAHSALHTLPLVKVSEPPAARLASVVHMNCIEIQAGKLGAVRR